MYPSDRDEIPMLPSAYLQSDAGNDSGSRGLSTRTRSASMSNPSNSMDSTEYEHNLVGFTGPLTNTRRAPNMQTSGLLYANQNREFVFQPPKGALRQKATEPKLDRTENIDRPAEEYMGRNEQLYRSGQLGMCNDPYCTTCPMYYNVKGRQKPSRESVIFDAKYGNGKAENGKNDIKETVDNHVGISNGRSNELESTEIASLDAAFIENETEDIALASDSDGYLSEDPSCPYVVESKTEKTLMCG